MVFVSTGLSTRQVKGEDVYGLPEFEHFPPPLPSARPHKLSSRRRESVEQHQQDHFVTLRVDKHGHPRFHCSTSLKPYEAHILEGVYERIIECLPGFSRPQRGNSKHDATGPQLMTSCPATAFMPPVENTGSVSFPVPQRGAKRRRSSTQVNARCSGSDNECNFDGRFTPSKTRKTTEVMVGNNVAMDQWLKDAFHAVQQVSCRLVAKLWIKRIHFKKQSTHPYNGGFPRDVPRDPERTKPYYWPHDVRHKEPDHITRDERVQVLMGVIGLTPLEEINSPDERKHFVTAQQLLDALEERKSDIPDDKWEILQDIVKARTYQERFSNGEIDPETVITLLDCSADTRRSQGETDDDIDDADRNHSVIPAEGCGETEPTTEEEPSITPVSSNLASPVHQVRAGGEQLMQMESSSTSTAFPGPFNSDAVKGEDGSNMSDAYQRASESVSGQRIRSQRTSPTIEMACKDYVRDIFTHGSLFPESQAQHIPVMPDFQDHQAQSQMMQFWPATMPPDLQNQTYATHQGFQNHAMTVDNQMGFNETQYHQSPVPRRQTAMHGLPYDGTSHYTPGFSNQDHPLPMRLASGLRQDLIQHELNMSPHNYYPD